MKKNRERWDFKYGRYYDAALNIKVPLVIYKKGDPVTGPDFFAELGNLKDVKTSVAYGTGSKIASPEASDLEIIKKLGLPFEGLWKTVWIKCLIEELLPILSMTDMKTGEIEKTLFFYRASWADCASLVRKNPETTARFFEWADNVMRKKKIVFLVLINDMLIERDGLHDGLISEWLLALFKCLQEYRFFPNLKFKALISEDNLVYDDCGDVFLFAFSDGSKLRHSAAWPEF